MVGRAAEVAVRAAMTSDRAGQHGIRIKDQYRVCFRWTDAGPEDVGAVLRHVCPILGDIAGPL
ncbi:hypothetical protein FG385_21730 [Amycolatopsis alkalitolerans]|uniref:Uncharacterized protein n=1 Tax=Amycolatopsis alkalitolerans TaxID=2547244 RepID=A0A5C4LVS3_9PSEU|nr:hypothetical protein FG385_21730 [Amycolatopsis alkalitolerans]